ncbi:helix-turn-helix domain-containing protein [Myroides profundi]|uniref:AraC-type DNA-binding protein n=1 Tax=Myroides profundi TaxID=480520 RepID=A0AAJ4W5G9_MYRPR|nr:helix-turn-helix transcriptional regulator [Myroides profundi]AJH15229.1 transcriptional regulator [Myroides profundi]SER24756.1 AraC-type DNA-binding protein [Myroides profundi]
MSLFLTLDYLYELHELDSSLKGDGVFIVDHTNLPIVDYAYQKHQFEGLLFGFVLKGKMTAQVHFLEYEVKAGEVIIALPHLMIDVVEESDDAEVITIGLSLDFISSIPSLWEFVTDDQIRWNPKIKFFEKEDSLERQFLAYLQQFYHKENSVKKNEILRYHILALFNMVIESYASLSVKNPVVKEGSHDIIDRFYTSITEHAIKHREVGFYADKLHLTPQYLTTLLKQKTGKSVLKWIDHMVVLYAKSLLKTTELSIKEISHELHFNDASLFCRHFKRNTGISPQQFRKNASV